MDSADLKNIIIIKMYLKHSKVLRVVTLVTTIMLNLSSSCEFEICDCIKEVGWIAQDSILGAYEEYPNYSTSARYTAIRDSLTDDFGQTDYFDLVDPSDLILWDDALCTSEYLSDEQYDDDYTTITAIDACGCDITLSTANRDFAWWTDYSVQIRPECTYTIEFWIWAYAWFDVEFWFYKIYQLNLQVTQNYETVTHSDQFFIIGGNVDSGYDYNYNEVFTLDDCSTGSIEVSYDSRNSLQDSYPWFYSDGSLDYFEILFEQTTSADAGTYNVTRTIYNLYEQMVVHLCELSEIDTIIDIIDSSESNEFYIDDVCMVDQDSTLDPCEASSATSSYPVHQLISLNTNIGKVLMSSSSPSECDDQIQFQVTCTEDCGDSSCNSFDNCWLNEEMFEFQIDHDTLQANYIADFTLTVLDVEIRTWSYLFSISQNLTLKDDSDSGGWLCLWFGNAAGPEGTNVCKDDYQMSKNAYDLNDYMQIDLDNFLDQSTVLSDRTLTIQISDLVEDNGSDTSEDFIYNDASNQESSTDTVVLPFKKDFTYEFIGIASGKSTITITVMYEQLTTISVSKTAEITIVDCLQQELDIPAGETQYIAKGESVVVTFSDAQFVHNNAWCYPFTIFGIYDDTRGKFIWEDDFPQNYLKSTTAEPLNDLQQLSFESWQQDTLWKENQYSYTAEFQIDESPMPTLNLRYWLNNNSRPEQYQSAVFQLIFYQVKIDRIWEIPTDDSDYQEFIFPQQIETWDGIPKERKAFSFTDYLETNEDETVYIQVEFTGYNAEFFQTGTDSDQIWIEYINTSPISQEVYDLYFQRTITLRNWSDDSKIEQVDLDAYTLDVKYSLVDCSKDFTPSSNFLFTEDVDIEANEMINIDGLGRHFVALYEQGEHKTYNLTLLQNEQDYQSVCGNIEYEIEIVELSLFQESFIMDGYDLTFDPLLSEAGDIFSTSLRWFVHNNFISYDIGETIFEQTNIIGFLKAQLESSTHEPNLDIKRIQTTSFILKIDLMWPKQLSFSWPEFEYQHYDLSIDEYEITCTDSENKQHTVGYDGNVLASESSLCGDFEYDGERRLVKAPFINTFNSKYAGQYTFMVRGANSEDTSIESQAVIFVIVITYDTSNQGPQLVTEPKRIIAQKSENFVYFLGEITDNEDDLVYLQEWSLSNEENLPWVIFHNNTDQNFLSFEIVPPETTSPQGFEIQFVLSDDNIYQGTTEYQVDVRVIEKNEYFIDLQNQVSDDGQPPLIQYKLDKDDNINVSFTQEVIYPKGFDTLSGEFRRLDQVSNDTNFFQISLELSESTKSTLYEIDQDIEILWQILVADLQNFKIITQFEPSELVSRDGLDPDRIKFQLLKPEIFMGINTRQQAVVSPGQNNFIEQEGYVVKLHGASGQYEAGLASVKALQGSFENTVQAFMVGNGFLGLFLSGIFQYLFEFLSILQLMVIPVLFTLNHPANAKIIQVTILKLCAFDFFQTEKVYGDIFGLEAGESFSAIFEQAGLEGHNFIVGIGPIFIYFLLFPFGILIHQLSRRFCQRKKFLAKFNRKSQYRLIMVSFLYTSCFELAISACISISQIDRGDFSNFMNFVSISLAFITFAAFFTTPVFILRMASKYFTQKDDEVYRERYKKLFDGLDVNGKFALNYPNFFLVRRYLATSLLVFLWDRTFALVQINGYVISTLVFMVYVLHVKPYSDSYFNRYEAINECFLIILLYTLYYYTRYLNIEGQREFEYNVGWLVIGLILVVIAGNMFAISRKVYGFVKKKSAILYHKSSFYKKRLQKEQGSLKVTQQMELHNQQPDQDLQIESYSINDQSISLEQKSELTPEKSEENITEEEHKSQTDKNLEEGFIHGTNAPGDLLGIEEVQSDKNLPENISTNLTQYLTTNLIQTEQTQETVARDINRNQLEEEKFVEQSYTRHKPEVSKLLHQIHVPQSWGAQFQIDEQQGSVSQQQQKQVLADSIEPDFLVDLQLARPDSLVVKKTKSPQKTLKKTNLANQMWWSRRQSNLLLDIKTQSSGKTIHDMSKFIL